MLTDPYLLFASCFATWLRLKIMMGFQIVLAIILMSLSAWLTQSQGGSFASITFPSGNKYSNWDSQCSKYPYAYLSPFTFTYGAATYGNSTIGGSGTSTMCPYPQPNSELRLSLTVMTIVFLGVLYVKTPFSLIARWIHAIFALMFFSAFVIDAAAATVGSYFCSENFPNTFMNKDITSMNLSLTCSGEVYQLVAAWDFLMSMIFFILHTAWGMAKDLYVEKGDSQDKKTLLGNKA
mmetsp:Transcript_11322/g.12226  ORF Transcript_11322/g.12226 Transcript_11322/m.12226 type:complete len:236 (+) Transcript_11322:217-924(+)|eukprot:gene2724-2901_t